MFDNVFYALVLVTRISIPGFRNRPIEFSSERHETSADLGVHQHPSTGIDGRHDARNCFVVQWVDEVGGPIGTSVDDSEGRDILRHVRLGF